MNELVISYSYPKGQRILSLICGGYFTIYGLYRSVLLALNKDFSVQFYLVLIAAVLGLILILSVSLLKAKPLVKIDSENIYIHMPNSKSVYTESWSSIIEVSIGISYLKFAEDDGHTYTVDISGLKYTDLKNVKSKIIEICESKTIPYKND